MRLLGSAANPRVQTALRLRRRRERDSSGLFLLEGAREIALALAGGIRIRQGFVCEELLLGGELELLERLQETAAELLWVTRRVAARLSYGERESAMVLVAESPRRDSPTLPEDGLVLVLDGLEKPGNVGAILRTADAVGVSAVFLVPGEDGSSVDLYNPNLIRASRGTVFGVPCAALSAEDALRDLREMPLVVATPEAITDFRCAELRPPLAIVVGREQSGVSALWRENARHSVSIPMRGRADSLNVSVTAALLLYEATRLRPAQADEEIRG
jgi:TrmH family RNA methyltransferase